MPLLNPGAHPVFKDIFIMLKMTGRKDARTSKKHLDVLSAFLQKSLVRIFQQAPIPP